MSQIPDGAVPITFAADRTAIDKYLAELRQGYTVPIRPQFQGGPQGYNGPNAIQQALAPYRGINAVGPGGSGGGRQSAEERETAAAERKRSQNARRVERAWDLAQLAQQKEAEAAEARARKAAQEGGWRGLRAGRLAQYATVGFLAREGLQAAQQYVDYKQSVALARSPLDVMEANQKLAESISSIPVVGQAASLFTSGASFRARVATMGAEESLRDVSNRAEADAGSRQTRSRAITMEERAETMGVRSGVARRVRQVMDEQTAADREESDRLADLNEKIATEQDPYQRTRDILRYNRIVRDRPESQAARKKYADAAIEDIQRDYNLTLGVERSQVSGLESAAEGQFGIAKEREFAGRLRSAEAAAYRQGTALGNLTAHNNRLRTAGEQEEIDLGVNLRDSGTLALAYEISRDPLAAKITRIRGQAQRDRQFARSDGDYNSINENEQAQIGIVQQNQRDVYYNRSVAQAAHNEQLAILTNQNVGTPASRELAAQVDEIRRRTEQRALGIFEEDEREGRSEAPGIFKGGRLELQALQQQYLNSFHAEEVNPNRTALGGAGTEDPSVVLKSIADAIKDLSQVPKTLDDIKNALGNLVAQ